MTTYASLPGLPASPTLTNPDMILPYGEYDSTPSPPQDAMHLDTLDGGWKGPIPDDLSFSIGPPAHRQLSTGPITPITPIIYGNGTMLSDIGEVTEAESTPGRKTKTTYARVNGRDSPVRSSPTMGYDTVKKRTRIRNHHRSVSMDSSSTVTTEGQPAELFKDFDDGISVDDSNFQGDDEESVLDDGYENELEVAQAKVITRKESRLINTDDISSAALSRRAEMILANAKKRLDNMEGNLTRARGSLFITPSSSMSSIHSSSPLSRTTPSPPDADHRIITGLGVPPARHRQINSPQILTSSSPGHTRILSESSVPSALKSPQQGAYPPGLLPESPLRSEHRNRDSVPTTYVTPSNRSSNNLATPLQLFSEDEAEPMEDGERVSIRASTAEPQSNILYDHRGLTRSTSSMQMRDLTDKMKDLKGKISTLRDRAREDNLKRRSLQSLRTPSPFTAAEQWHTNPKAYKGTDLVKERRLFPSPWNGEPSVTESVDGGDVKVAEQEPQPYGNVDEFQDAEGEDYIEAEPETAHLNQEASRTSSELDENYDTALEGEEGEGEEEEDGEPQDDGVEEIGDEQYDDELVDHNELEDYESESGASLYHDSMATPLSHEDREDAFDYEHFFLHSAMGTISAQRLARRGSSSSFSSEDSVETARGPEISVPLSQEGAEEVNGDPRGHVRSQKSTDSVSTMASFATATEGRRSSEVPDGYVAHEDAPQNGTEPFVAETGSTTTPKRSTFGNSVSTVVSSERYRAPSPISRPASVVRASSAQAAKHHASISSFSSTGTTRSFPLVNKPKNMNPEPHNSILSDALTLNGVERPLSSIDMLAKEDRILVERLVASVGKCVLGLQEAGRASSEGRMWRRRLDAARRILEGQDSAI